ncbi:MAG TPA: ATP-binding protein [Acidimicrobiales bacterium]|nr:ATP-binding protein [Acidimicrobiales bacterium]
MNRHGLTQAVTLQVPARAEHLGLVRTVVTTMASSFAGLEGVRLDDLRLAVSEACVNAIEAYASRGTPGLVISVRIHAEPGCIEVEVHDEAGGFDPGELVPHPPVEAPERLHHERGLGVPLMRALADNTDFLAEGGGTTVRLVLRERRAIRQRRVDVDG